MSWLLMTHLSKRVTWPCPNSRNEDIDPPLDGRGVKSRWKGCGCKRWQSTVGSHMDLLKEDSGDPGVISVLSWGWKPDNSAGNEVRGSVANRYYFYVDGICQWKEVSKLVQRGSSRVRWDLGECMWWSEYIYFLKENRVSGTKVKVKSLSCTEF